MTFRYFAYGSNMLPARLTARCASARVVGKARAVGFALEFSKASIDGSGKATIVNQEDSNVRGVVFEIDDVESRALDKCEGAGKGYQRIDDFQVEMLSDGERIFTTTYISTLADPRLKPYDWYLAVVIAGAVYHGFDEQDVAKLRAINYIIDEKLDRPARADALDAMIADGISDFRVMLRL